MRYQSYVTSNLTKLMTVLGSLKVPNIFSHFRKLFEIFMHKFDKHPEYQ